MPDSCDPVDCSLPGSSAHGILQARTLGWVTVSFSSKWGLIASTSLGHEGAQERQRLLKFLTQGLVPGSFPHAVDSLWAIIRNTPGGLQSSLRERSRVPTSPAWQTAGEPWCAGSPGGSSPFSQLLRGSVCSSPGPLRKKDHQERTWSYLLYIQFCLSGSNHSQQKPPIKPQQTPQR